MGLAEDLKALQDLRDKGEMAEADYVRTRDGIIRKHQPPPSTSSKIGRITRFVPILVLVGLVVWYLASQVYRQALHRSSATAAPQYQPPIPLLSQPHTAQITNGALTVRAGGLSWYQFFIPANASNVMVNGHFTATGGIGNDIICYITDQDGLANLQNGHQARVFYNSQRETQSQISATLPNGTGNYYLVFDNRFSLITPKAVQVNATLTYLQ